METEPHEFGIAAIKMSVILLKPKRMNRILLFVSLFLALSFGVSAQKALNNTNNIISTDTSRTKKKVIKIHPDPSYGKLSISASTSSSLNFYIFDLEGTLVFQAVLINKEKKTIENLRKGTYLYDVFEQDISIEEGQIVIK